MLEDLPDGFWHALLLLLPDNEAFQLSRVSRTLRRRVSSAPALNAGVTVGLSTLEVCSTTSAAGCWRPAASALLLMSLARSAHSRLHPALGSQDDAAASAVAPPLFAMSAGGEHFSPSSKPCSVVPLWAADGRVFVAHVRSGCVRVSHVITFPLQRRRVVDGIRAFFGAAGAEPRLVTLYVTLRVAALPAGGGFMAEQLHAAEAMRSLFPDVRLSSPYS